MFWREQWDITDKRQYTVLCVWMKNMEAEEKSSWGAAGVCVWSDLVSQGWHWDLENRSEEENGEGVEGKEGKGEASKTRRWCSCRMEWCLWLHGLGRRHRMTDLTEGLFSPIRLIFHACVVRWRGRSRWQGRAASLQGWRWNDMLVNCILLLIFLQHGLRFIEQFVLHID